MLYLYITKIKHFEIYFIKKLYDKHNKYIGHGFWVRVNCYGEFFREWGIHIYFYTNSKIAVTTQTFF